MARPSKTDKLPTDVKAQINRLRQDGAEIDDIVAFLAQATPGWSSGTCCPTASRR